MSDTIVFISVLIAVSVPFIAIATMFFRWDAELRRDHQRMQDRISDLRSGRWGAAAAEREQKRRERKGK